MKLYVKIENTHDDVFRIVITGKNISDCLTKALMKMPASFSNGCQLKSRIYISEVGFDSDISKFYDTCKALKRAGYQFE